MASEESLQCGLFDLEISVLYDLRWGPVSIIFTSDLKIWVNSEMCHCLNSRKSNFQSGMRVAAGNYLDIGIFVTFPKELFVMHKK
jgi:hypothetical protein